MVEAAGVDEDVCEQDRGDAGEALRAFGELDATLIEVNPLVVTSERDVVALDSKTTIDNNGAVPHEDIAAYEDLSAMDPQERMAKEKGSPTSSSTATSASSPTALGLHVHAGRGRPGRRRPANFLDAGGGSKADAIVAALEVITSDEKVKAILFNIFGGITRCDEIAKGIIEPRADRHRRAADRAPRRHQLRGGAGTARRRRPSRPARGEDDAGRAAKVVEVAFEVRRR